MTVRVTRARTLAGELAGAFERASADLRAGSYPLTRYQRDPLAYVRERLHVEHVMPHQAAILMAIARGIAGEAPDRVATRSGQKCGKTATAIWAALWFYECFGEARVFLCAAIIEQTKNVLWRELGQTLRRARERGADVDGRLAQSPAGGLVSVDGSREIKGISGREVEALAGLSGRTLTIIDEASHLATEKAEVFQGNAMGGGSQLWISNPTRSEGPFYEAFHALKDFWQTFHVDGEEVARWQAETGIRIPYTVTLEKVDEARAMFGEDSPFWALRVKGNWLRNETGRCIPMWIIEAAIARWAEVSDEGVLAIGYDVAGPGDGGDDHCWAPVRGAKCLAIIRDRALDEEQALAKTYAILDVYRREGEVPRIMVDSEGPYGSAIYGRLRAESERRLLQDARKGFDVFGVKASSRSVRDPSKFERVRDELVWVLGEWMRDGAAIPNDPKLQAELYAPRWSSVPGGQLRTTPKTALRDLLNRSPDSADALALAVRQPHGWRAEDVDDAAHDRAPLADAYEQRAERTFDPYEGQRAWQPRREPGGPDGD